LAYTRRAHPGHVDLLIERIERVVEHIREMPQSAPLVARRAGVRMVPLRRYPYLLFYRVRKDHLEILGLIHAARRRPSFGE
jgi:hypothetical protein